MSKEVMAWQLNREHLLEPVSVTVGQKTYAGILAQVGHSRHHLTSVHVLIESSDRAVIRGSLYIKPEHQITLTGGSHV